MTKTQTEKGIRAAVSLFLILILAALFGCERTQAQMEAGKKRLETTMTENMSWDFDDISVGELPVGWKVDATNRKGPLATWRIINDPTSVSGGRVLAMVSPNHTSGSTFNICWTDSVFFLDGEIEVRFKAVRGEEDQGGGIIWRVQDRDNYYIARFNPLEDNFRIYYVRNGRRRTLASVRISLPAGTWHTLKVVQHGNRFEGYLNGKRVLNGTDTVFTRPGGIGLWTKADAVTYFDDLAVRPLKKEINNNEVP